MGTGSRSHGGAASHGLTWTVIGAVRGRRTGRAEQGVPPTVGRRGLSSPRVAAEAMMLGGALWVLYGPLEMTQPWGADVVYRDAKGYSVVVDTAGFLAYSLPGSLAVILTGAGLLGVTAHIRSHQDGVARAARGVAYVAVGLGLISLVGVAVLFDPVFTAGRIFGTLALAGAVLMTAVVAHRADAGRSWVVALALLGASGAFLLPLRPLMNVLSWFTEEVGALFIALFGIGWLGVGGWLWRAASRAPAGETAAA